MKELKYSGLVFKRNGGQDAHIRDKMRKAGIVMKGVWGIGKITFGKD